MTVEPNTENRSSSLLALEREIVWFLGDAAEDASSILNHLSKTFPDLTPRELGRAFEDAIHELWKGGLISVCHLKSEFGVGRPFEENSTHVTDSVGYRSSEKRWNWRQTTTRVDHPVISLTSEGYRKCGF